MLVPGLRGGQSETSGQVGARGRVGTAEPNERGERLPGNGNTWRRRGKQADRAAMSVPERRIIPPFAKESWRGFEWLSDVADVQMYVSHDVATKQQLILTREDVSESCVALSVASFAPNKEALDAYWEAQGKERVRVDHLEHTIRSACRRLRIRLVLHTLTPIEGSTYLGWRFLSHPAVLGNEKAPCVGHLVLVPPTPDFVGHLLPASEVHRSAQVLTPFTERRALPPPEPVKGPPRPYRVQPWCPSQAPVVPPPASAAEESFAELNGLGEGESLGPQCLAPSSTSSGGPPGPTTPALTPSGLAPTAGAESAPAGQDVPNREGGNPSDPEDEWVQVPPEEEPEFRGRFSGFNPPPSGFQWVGGWLPGRPPPGVTASWTSLLPTFPHLCSASLQAVARYGDSVAYWPAQVEGGDNLNAIRHVTARRLECGGVYVDIFLKGDVLSRDGCKYVVEDHSTIKGAWALRCTDWTVKLQRLMPNMLRQPRVVVETEGQLVTERAEAVKVAYAVTLQTLVDPMEIAAYRMAYNFARDKKFEKVPSAAAALAQVRRQIKEAGVPQDRGYVCGRGYDWGYCYSCGTMPKGQPKLKGRLCVSCRKSNTRVGRLVADGHHVASVANPIVYPGVVNTESRHPPLKEGVKTFISEANFRFAPSGL